MIACKPTNPSITRSLPGNWQISTCTPVACLDLVYNTTDSWYRYLAQCRITAALAGRSLAPPNRAPPDTPPFLSPHSLCYAPWVKPPPKAANSFQQSRKPPLCLRCGFLGRALECKPSQPSRSERPFLAKSSNNQLVNITCQPLCVM